MEPGSVLPFLIFCYRLYFKIEQFVGEGKY